MASDSEQHVDMLRILAAVSETALEALANERPVFLGESLNQA
jgi:hypothetical protein